MYKLLATDLDKTLLNDQGMVSPENKEAIIKAKEKGVQIVLCSGRMFDRIEGLADQLSLMGAQSYLVSQNGAFIFKNRELLFHTCLSKEDVLSFYDYSIKNKMLLLAYTEEVLYSNIQNEWYDIYYNNMQVKPVVIDFRDINVPVGKLMLFDDRTALECATQDLHLLIKAKFNMFYSRQNALEFVRKDINKGIAIQQIAEKIGLDRKEVIAVGDHENDISMVSWAGLGVAVHNAENSVKKVANYITIQDNNHHAIAEVIYKYIL